VVGDECVPNSKHILTHRSSSTELCYQRLFQSVVFISSVDQRNDLKLRVAEVAIKLCGTCAKGVTDSWKALS